MSRQKLLADKFKTWGKQQVTLPPNSEAKKAAVLGVFRSRTVVSVKKPRPFWPLLFSITGTFIVILFVTQFVLPAIQPATNTSSYPAEYDLSNEERVDLNNQLRSASGLGENLRQASLGDNNNKLSKILQPITNSIEEISHSFKQQNNSSIEDTREFLKTDYGINIKTRQVERIHTRLQTIIKGHGGRIDYLSVNPKYGSISFVIPKSSLSQFSTEIQDLFHPKFLTERISAQNLLPEKRVIEIDTEVQKQSLTDLEAKRQNQIEQHNSQVEYIQNEMKKYSNSIYALKNETTTSTERQSEIKAQLAYFNNKYYSLKQLLEKENTSFDNSLQETETQIQAKKHQLSELNEQDTELLNNVETVEGTISLQWISILDAINLYVPIYWILILSCVGVIVFYLLWGRRRMFDQI